MANPKGSISTYACGVRPQDVGGSMSTRNTPHIMQARSDIVQVKRLSRSDVVQPRRQTYSNVVRPKRSERLIMVGKFTFKNTKEAVVRLDED